MYDTDENNIHRSHTDNTINEARILMRLRKIRRRKYAFKEEYLLRYLINETNRCLHFCLISYIRIILHKNPQSSDDLWFVDFVILLVIRGHQEAF